MSFVIKPPKDEYIIHQVNNTFLVCKIIKTCNTEDKAIDEILKLLNKKGD